MKKISRDNVTVVSTILSLFFVYTIILHICNNNSISLMLLTISTGLTIFITIPIIFLDMLNYIIRGFRNEER